MRKFFETENTRTYAITGSRTVNVGNMNLLQVSNINNETALDNVIEQSISKELLMLIIDDLRLKIVGESEKVISQIEIRKDIFEPVINSGYPDIGCNAIIWHALRLYLNTMVCWY